MASQVIVLPKFVAPRTAAVPLVNDSNVTRIGLTLRLQNLENPSGGSVMKRTLLIALIGLTSACCAFAQGSASLSFSGPSTWVPGTSVTLAGQDTFSIGGSYGFSFWLQVNTSLAPFLTITNIVYYPPFGGTNPPFPILFNIAGDSGFTGEAPGLGGGAQGLIPDGSYHAMDITFALAAGAPVGTYTLRTTTASPRGSIQVTSDFNDFPLPQASFVFNVVPEPSTLALIMFAAAGASLVAYRCRK